MAGEGRGAKSSLQSLSGRSWEGSTSAQCSGAWTVSGFLSCAVNINPSYSHWEKKGKQNYAPPKPLLSVFNLSFSMAELP